MSEVDSDTKLKEGENVAVEFAPVAIVGKASDEETQETSSFYDSEMVDVVDIVKQTEIRDVEKISDGDGVVREEEDSVIFHCISYLGAAKITEANNEGEIQKIITFLNEQSSTNVIQVSVSVPFHSDGDVIIYEEDNQKEISTFKINQIIFFARGTIAGNKSDAACFAFTCSHGKSLQEAIFQCHAFKCDVPEAVGRVYQSFATAFSAPPKHIEERPIMVESITSNRSDNSDNFSDSQESTTFEVSLEFKEDDGKGNFHAVPRDKGYFKLKSSIPKQIVLTVQQIPDNCKELIVERCFGLLLSPGRHVRHSDMQLVEMLSWSIGSGTGDRKSYVVTGQWDCNDPAFEPLNQETSKESYIFLTVAVDLVIKGIQEPIRFALETKAKIYPATERFWILSRKHHITQQFGLVLQKSAGSTKGSKVLDCRALGEVDKNKMNFNLNFTSFIRSSSIGSIELETPTVDDDDSDDDEPLQSGVGEISKDCSDEQIAAWSDILNIWPPESTTRPKQLTPLVRAGIPDAVRSNMWLRLANCLDDTDMFEAYKILIAKECSSDDVILRDISRTMPANDYFKESGTGQELLFKISRGYAIHDAEVGYCQGISFIGAALLLQMPEEQAFCLLVKMMFDYGFRDLYRDGFDNLHLSLYQLDKLIEEKIPELWTHFQELGIESHMYASQWLLTCFCGKFPLVFVFRVIDIVLLDGFKTIFQIAVALLAAARKDLLVLDFEGILKYFRVNLPKKYRTPEATNSLMQCALNIKVKKMKRYKKEYLAIKENERNYVDPITRLTHDNKKLMEDVMRYEYVVTNLVLTKVNAEERCSQLEDDLARTRTSLKEKEEINTRLEEETNSVKELFQREVKQYDTEGGKKDNVISEYKQICSKLSSQLEIEQKLSRERMNFFQSNLCPSCNNFVTTAINIAASSGGGGGGGGGGKPNGDSGDSSTGERRLEDIVKPLENELAKTKIALAEAECRNDDMNHRLQVALAELETYRNNSTSSGPTWLWKNLSFNKDKKSSIPSSSSEDAVSVHAIPSIVPQPFAKK